MTAPTPKPPRLRADDAPVTHLVESVADSLPPGRSQSLWAIVASDDGLLIDEPAWVARRGPLAGVLDDVGLLVRSYRAALLRPSVAAVNPWGAALAGVLAAERDTDTRVSAYLPGGSALHLNAAPGRRVEVRAGWVADDPSYQRGEHVLTPLLDALRGRRTPDAPDHPLRLFATGLVADAAGNMPVLPTRSATLDDLADLLAESARSVPVHPRQASRGAVGQPPWTLPLELYRLLPELVGCAEDVTDLLERRWSPFPSDAARH